MRVDEYVSHDATALAELIREGAVKPDEVAEAAAAALDAVQPELNALVGERFAEPLAYSADGPFAGVPFAIKDLVLHADGIPQRAGSRLLGDGVAMPGDSYLMAQFRAAGLATMGLTATPELGFNASTEPVATGPVRNPWDTTRSPGGSSGGSAALVASRALPMAHANDGGGSIRIPAGCCGLVGLKPTRGRTTPGPDYGDLLLGLAIEFAVTRTVRDCARLLDAVHGAQPGDRYLLPAPERPFAEEVRAGSRPLRIAVSTTPSSGPGSVDPQCVAAVRGVAEQLESMGHTVVEAAPTIDAAAFDDANLVAWTSFLADAVDQLATAVGVTPGPDTLEATTLACAEHGRTLRAADLYAADRVFNATTRAVAAFFTEHDVLLTPTTCAPNTPLGHLDANASGLDARGWYDRIFSFAGFTAVSNVTGMPAISLPLGSSAEGWPIGVQLGAGLAGEATLLALAADLERAMPWSDRRPAVVAD
ncbi:amidase [Pseudonocardia asaccharolytica]|uniref:Amidase n=1 Tax=Pseudonocardia asaccharolytica DSM 44247 = NBRC 16224 TaxID=1123024 RepID=A0A511CXY8_9PSEU|nr:amidase family protein [Pseudonocardia asaccharolytica]GEL17113.1 amidase [Pseudonocardia asaccharolytica DSM 44247 = NBRC 16224]